MQSRTRSALWCTLLVCVELSIHQHDQVLLRQALNSFIPQPGLILGIALTQVQHFAPALTDLQDLPMHPLVMQVHVPLHGIPSLTHVNCTAQLSLVSPATLPRVHLDPTMSLVKVWNSTSPSTDPWGTASSLSPCGHWAIDLYSIDEYIQPIPHPWNSPSIKSILLQFREKGAAGGHVKDPTETQTVGIHGLFPV